MRQEGFFCGHRNAEAQAKVLLLGRRQGFFRPTSFPHFGRLFVFRTLLLFCFFFGYQQPFPLAAVLLFLGALGRLFARVVLR